MSDNTDAGKTSTTLAKSTTTIAFLSLPRVLCLWPLITFLFVFGLFSTLNITPNWLSGLTLHAVLILAVVIREFDFRTGWHLGIAVVITTCVVLTLLVTNFLPALEWFSAAGEGCLCTAGILTLVVTLSCIMKMSSTRVDKRAEGASVTYNGKSVVITPKAKIVANETDVAESILITGGLRKVGTITISQPQDKGVPPCEAVIKGVVNPRRVAEVIKKILGA